MGQLRMMPRARTLKLPTMWRKMGLKADKRHRGGFQVGGGLTRFHKGFVGKNLLATTEVRHFCLLCVLLLSSFSLFLLVPRNLVVSPRREGFGIYKK